MTDVIQITRLSEQEFIEGARSPNEDILIPTFLPAKSEEDHPRSEELSINEVQSKSDEGIPKKSADLEILYFKEQQGGESLHQPRQKRLHIATLNKDQDPYDELISTAFATFQHLEYIRNCSSKVKDILEDPCPGFEDEVPLVTRVQAWKYAIEYGIQCLGKARYTDNLSKKAVKDKLEDMLGVAVSDVQLMHSLIRELIKNLDQIEKLVEVIQSVGAKVFKENLVGAGTAEALASQLSLNQEAKHSHTADSPDQSKRKNLPQGLLALKHLWIRFGIDGISLKTGSRTFWIKLMTVSLPHKFQLLTIFLDQLRHVENECEELLKTARHVLVNPATPEQLNETEFLSIQALVRRLPTLLKSRKKLFTPKEQVIGLRTCWKLKKEFAHTKSDLNTVDSLITEFKETITGLYKDRNRLFSGRATYFAASQRLKLLVEDVGTIDIQNLFDSYSAHGAIDKNECGDSCSEMNTNSRPLSLGGSDLTMFTVLDSLESLERHGGEITASDLLAHLSELDLPLIEILQEYETAFIRVKSSGILTTPDIQLCSDIVTSFLECSNCLTETLNSNTEKIRSSLRYLESDSYKLFPGILVWANLVIKTLLITNFSPSWKQRMSEDFLTLLEMQEKLKTSITKHETSLEEFKDYVNDVLYSLRYRDSKFSKMMAEVIPVDHFVTMISNTEQNLFLPNIHFERDEFSIRISMSRNECKIFSIPASGSTEGTRIVKFSILDKRVTANFLIQAIEFMKSIMSTTVYILDTASHVLSSSETGRILKLSDLQNLTALQPFEKLTILIRLKSVLTSLAQNFVIFEEVKRITRQLHDVFEAMKLVLRFEDFKIPNMDHIDLETTAPWVPLELKNQFTSFQLYHYIPHENPVLTKIVRKIHNQHGMTLTEVVRRENDWLGFRVTKHRLPPVNALELRFKEAAETADVTPEPGQKVFRRIPLKMFLREIPKIVHSVVDEHAEAKPATSNLTKTPEDFVPVDNRMCIYFNAFTNCLQSKILKSVQNLHLPKASIYVEKLSETRPIVGNLEALCFFIGIASAQLNSSTLPAEEHTIYEKLRPKFFEFTNALVAFQNTRKEVYACIWKKVESTLSTLEYENKDKLEMSYGEEIPELDELHKLSPIPPPNVVSSIWDPGNEAKEPTAPIPRDKLVIFHWNVWKYDTLEIEYKPYADVFEFSGMTFRSRAKILHYMMDQALAVLNKSLTFLKDSKTDITEAGRIISGIKAFLNDLDQDFQIRPEQIYVILRTLRSRIVGVGMYLDRAESVLKRCRFFLSHGIRHIRAHLHEVESFHRDFEANPFHYLSLRVEMELAQPIEVVRHGEATGEEEHQESKPAPTESPIGDQVSNADHSRTVLKFFESFGNEVHRLGKLFVSGLQTTHSCLSSPSACADPSEEPSIPKIVGLAIIIGQAMMEIRTYSELVAKENSIVTLVEEVEKAVDEFPNRNANKLFRRNTKGKFLEALEGTDTTISKISNLLNAPFNMAGGLEPKIQVKSSIDPEMFSSKSSTSLASDASSQIWNLEVSDSEAKLVLTRNSTSETHKFADLNTMKQVGILKQLLQTLQEVLEGGSKTLEADGIASIKDAGARLKLVKQGLKTFLKTHAPNADETFDLSTILDDLHFSMELAKSTWAQINLEMQATLRILNCAAAYMRLRFVTAGIKATAVYMPTTTKNPYRRKKAGTVAQTHRQQQIQRKYVAKIGEVEEHLRSLIVTSLSIPIHINLSPHSLNL